MSTIATDKHLTDTLTTFQVPLGVVLGDTPLAPLQDSGAKKQRFGSCTYLGERYELGAQIGINGSWLRATPEGWYIQEENN